jgi:hypothetical protein
MSFARASSGADVLPADNEADLLCSDPAFDRLLRIALTIADDEPGAART